MPSMFSTGLLTNVQFMSISVTDMGNGMESSRLSYQYTLRVMLPESSRLNTSAMIMASATTPMVIYMIISCEAVCVASISAALARF